MGSGYNVVVATVKIEIRRGPFAISPQVDGSNLEPYLLLPKHRGRENLVSRGDLPVLVVVLLPLLMLLIMPVLPLVLVPPMLVLVLVMVLLLLLVLVFEKK